LLGVSALSAAHADGPRANAWPHYGQSAHESCRDCQRRWVSHYNLLVIPLTTPYPSRGAACGRVPVPPSLTRTRTDQPRVSGDWPDLHALPRAVPSQGRLRLSGLQSCTHQPFATRSLGLAGPSQGAVRCLVRALWSFGEADQVPEGCHCAGAHACMDAPEGGQDALLSCFGSCGRDFSRFLLWSTSMAKCPQLCPGTASRRLSSCPRWGGQHTLT